MRGKKARFLRKTISKKTLSVEYKRIVHEEEEIEDAEGNKITVPTVTQTILGDCERKQYRDLKRNS